jgi:catechol 2,3-dioxygenase-like lactoylglutathione lyase family enzyme
MIARFDHVVIGVRDLEAGVSAYETLLSARAGAHFVHDGVARASIALGNIDVELMAPDGDGEQALRLRAALEGGEGLMSLAFATLDIERTHRRFERVGLQPEPVRDAHGPPGAKVFRVGKSQTHGVRMFVMQRSAEDAPQAAGVSGIDHIVVRAPALEPAEALFGARLGLSLRRVLSVKDHTLALFRCGDAVLEVVVDASTPDWRAWGLSWRVPDADAAQARLRHAGLDVSEVRAGVGAGTRVFTVRNRTCGIPTLMIAPSNG